MRGNPAAPGTYLLLLRCQRESRLPIGKLGEMTVQPGYYVYVGSAFGPGGVRARVSHHRETAARAHWHIDYLRRVAEPVDAWCVYGARCEHAWAARLQRGPVSMPLQGFGASDCDCLTHLFYCKRRPHKARMESLLGIELEHA